MADHTFRVTPEGKYIYNNQEISKEEFEKRKSDVDAAIQQMRGPSKKGMSLKDRAKSAFDELNTDMEQKKYNNGGKVRSASARADGICKRGKTRGKMN